MTVKHIFFGSLITITYLFGSNQALKSQSIEPAIQAKIDSLNTWIKLQLETTGQIDKYILDSLNHNIREAQNRINSSTYIASGSNNESDEKTIMKDMMPGSVFTVPQGVKWRIKRISCKTDMGGYSVLVTSVKFKEFYSQGEQISMPAFTSEASLLTEDTSSVIYTFEIIESTIHK